MINYSQNNNSNSNTYHKNNNNYRKNVKYNRNIIPWMRKNTFSDDKKTLMEKLDQEIKDFVDYIKSTDEEKKMRDYVIEKLNNVVTKIWPDAKICVYGSFPLDLYLPVSDIDIVINGGNKYTDGPIYKLADELEKNNFFENMDVIATAKIPIIKVSEKISRCNVDITFDHNINFEKMRDLVVQYNNEFPELKPLLLILKYVLYQRNLNIPFQGGIGSFALLVLIRHFLCYYLGKRGFGPMAKHYKENNEDNEEYESSHEDENQPFGINNQDKPNSRMQNTSKKNGLNGHSKTIPTDGFPPTSIKNGSKQKKKNKKKNGAKNTDSNQSGDFQKKTPEEGMNGVDSNKSKYAIGSPHSTSSHIKVVPKNSSNKTDVHVKLNGHSQSHNIKNNNTTSSFNSNNKQNQSFKEKFHNPEISSNGFHENNKSENQKEKNKKRKLKRPNLGELLVNFFKYFGEFNFVSNGVSADGTFSKEERGFIDQQIPWKLYVDDPINPSNNLGSATYHVLTIRDFFKDCHEVLTDENASSNTILTRIIILDPHLDKHRSYTYHNFNEKIQSYNNSNSNTNSNNYRYNNYNNNNHGNSHHHSNSHSSNGSYHNNYNNGNSYYNRNHNNQKATNGQY